MRRALLISCLLLPSLGGCASCEKACAVVGGLFLIGAASAAENTSDQYPPDSYVPNSEIDNY